MLIPAGTTSFSIDVQIVDDTGLAVTGLVAATFPATSWSLNNNTAATAITLSDLAAITTAYTSGGVKERSGGYYRLDVPNAAIAGAGEVTLIGEASGKHLLAAKIVCASFINTSNRVDLGAIGGNTNAVGLNGNFLKVDAEQFLGAAVPGAFTNTAGSLGGFLINGSNSGPFNVICNGTPVKFQNTSAAGDGFEIVGSSNPNSYAINAHGERGIKAYGNSGNGFDIYNAGVTIVDNNGFIGVNVVDVGGAAINPLIGGRVDSAARLTAQGQTDVQTAMTASTALAAVKTDTGNLINMTTGTGTSRAYTAPALANAPAGTLVITPILSTLSNPRFSTADLPQVPQYSAQSDGWTLVDSNGASVNLGTNLVRLVGYRDTENNDDTIFDNTEAAAFKYETGGSGIVVSGSGTNTNVVTLTHSTNTTATTGDFRYWLWDITRNVVLAKGKLPIVPAVKNYP